MAAALVVLPHGLPDPGAVGSWAREAWIRPLSGRDELLLGEWEGLPRAEQSLRLLERLVVRLGTRVGPMPAEILAFLTAGDVTALLLSLRHLTFGERLDLVAECEACGEALDLAVPIEALRLPPQREAAARYAVECEGRALVVRALNGADLARAASAPAVEAVAALLAECVLEAKPALGPWPWPDSFVSALSAALEGLDPQADLRLSTLCPACGAGAVVNLDIASVLWRELAEERARLDREVHCLAYAYHWSEEVILNLARERRRRYVALIGEAWTGERA